MVAALTVLVPKVANLLQNLVNLVVTEVSEKKVVKNQKEVAEKHLFLFALQNPLKVVPAHAF